MQKDPNTKALKVVSYVFKIELFVSILKTNKLFQRSIQQEDFYILRTSEIKSIFQVIL